MPQRRDPIGDHADRSPLPGFFLHFLKKTMSALKKIKVEQLRLGMYFCGFEASWMDHPFWKNEFLLKSPAHLKQAQESGIEFCWIDPSKGLDVVEDGVDGDDAPVAEAAAPLSVEPVEPDASEPSDDITDAQHLYQSAKKVTQAMFSEARLGKAIDMEHCLPLVEEIASSVMCNSTAFISVARLKHADEYTYMHSVAVCALMVALGRTLGMDEATCKEAGLAGFLHDIGKAFIPLEILNKPGKLTEDELKIVRRHPALGYDYLKKDPNVPEYAREVCLHHHEKMDGTGYPGQQDGSIITLFSRMAAICDVYDAITSDRPYKKGWDPAESLAQMTLWAGHFDRPMFLAFVKTLGIYPVGSIVKLQSGRSALVIRQNETNLTKPVVKTFRFDDSFEVAESEILDLSDPAVTDSIAQRGGEDWLKAKAFNVNSLSHLR